MHWRNNTILYFLILVILTLSSCNRKKIPDISGIDIECEIQRFDRELFEISKDSMDDKVTGLYSKYEDFFDIFGYYIISIGRPSSRDFSEYLQLFVNDPLNREVFDSVQNKFPDLTDIEEELSLAFKIFRYYYPDQEIPVAVSYVSRFNQPTFTVSNYIGIGLDMYLGSSSGFYKQMNLPEYRRRFMIPEKISSDALFTWTNASFPFNDSINNSLSNMIHQGKLLYFLSRLLPNQTDEMIIGYTSDQLNWCEKNAEQMWMYLIEHKLLFSQDPLVIRKLTGMAPFTSYFTDMSPGRAGVWIGWQIVKKYMQKSKHVSLQELMSNTDYESILRISGYNPK